MAAGSLRRPHRAHRTRGPRPRPATRAQDRGGELTDGGRAAAGLDPAVAGALAAAFEREWARVVATLIAATGDWDVAEEAAAGAFERAALTWPRDGVPRNPGAWLTTTARNLALDRLRRRGVEAGKLEEVGVMQQRGGRGPLDPAEAATDDPAWDDRLRLIFTCAHPALPLESRVALTLRAVGGLSTAEIARAFFVSEPTMAQRIVRAKAKIAHAAIPYRVPPPDALPERLAGVLAVLYLSYNEGYLASSGEQLQRLDLTAEAIRLTRLLVELLPDGEAVALLALMLLQHARSATRADADGELVPLEAQDRTRWDSAQLAEGLALLASAAASSWGPYRVQAEIQAVHARAVSADATDWRRILALYDLLPATPFVALNRAIALGMAEGPSVGLAALDELRSGPLRDHHLLAAAIADLSRRGGDRRRASAAYLRAIALAPTGPERRYLERRLADLA